MIATQQEIDNVTTVFNMFNEVGIFKDLLKVGISHNNDSDTWDVNGCFRNDVRGYWNGRIGQFPKVTLAVVYENLVRDLINSR